MDRQGIETISESHPVVFFDGVCGLCNGAVDWILAHDSNGRFRFAPLQGEAAFLTLNETERRELTTIILVKNRRHYKRSDAIVQVLLDLKTPWRWLGRALASIPRPIRDAAYRAVAKFRYRIWGERDTCRLPTNEERSRFIV